MKNNSGLRDCDLFHGGEFIMMALIGQGSFEKEKGDMNL